MKAIKNGTKLDLISSVVLFVMYAIPGFMLGILLIQFFASGNYLELFPVQGLVGDNYEYLGLFEKLMDRVHHFILPLICYMIGSFTMLTMLMKNSLLDEIKKDYIERRERKVWMKIVYLKHDRNALIYVTGIGGFLTAAGHF